MPCLPAPELRASDPTEDDNQPPHLLVVPDTLDARILDLLVSDLPVLFLFLFSACDG